jgi:hypothetical protein
MFKTIHIDFTSPKSKLAILSWAIRKIERCEYSHLRLRWLGMGQKIPIVYEASGSEVKFLGPMAQEKRHVNVIKSYQFHLNQDQYYKTVEFCIKYAGVEYGKMQLLGMGLVRLFGLKKNPFGNGQVCSELVGKFLKEVMLWELELDLDVAGPKEIMEAIDKYFLNFEKQEV